MWSIGIYEGDSVFSMKPSTKIKNPVITIESITDVPAGLVADPFMIFVNNQWYMFFEVMNEDEKKGEIGAATSKDLSNWNYIGIVLKENFHLSYPFIFMDGDDVYMAPETLGVRGVTLYKASSFPHSWHREDMLVEGTHADPTIIKHDGLWWLFSCTTPYQHDSLSISWAENLHGPWLPHSLSPIYSGSKSISRPAGRMVNEGGNIIRFFQNCSRIYGESVGVAQIQRLSKDHYDERIKEGIDILGPTGIGWNATRMHHVDCHRTETGGWVACVDGHL